MLMLVLVSLREMKPNADSHQYTGCRKLGGDRLVQEDHGNDRAQEGSRREISARAGCAEIPKRKHEQSNTYTVTEKANECGDGKLRQIRDRSAAPDAKKEVGRPGNQALQLHDLEWIGKRNFSGEIVVEAPCHASPGNGQRPE